MYIWAAVVFERGIEPNVVRYETALGSILHYLARDSNTCITLVRKADARAFSELVY
jgi:hypothetical protein